MFLNCLALSASQGLVAVLSIRFAQYSSILTMEFKSVLHRVSASSILSKSILLSFMKSPRAIMFSRVVVTVKVLVRNSGSRALACSTKAGGSLVTCCLVLANGLTEFCLACYASSFIRASSAAFFSCSALISASSAALARSRCSFRRLAYWIVDAILSVSI